MGTNPPPPPPPPTGSNAAAAWGDSNNGKLAGGYSSQMFFPFPQGCIDMSNIAMVGAAANVTGFVTHDGRLFVCGNNEGDGTVGVGTNAVDIYTPTRIAGGVPLYPRETITYEKTKTWQQPQGPLAPNLLGATVRAFAGGGGANCYALLANGRVLAWGSGSEGQLGNGYDARPSPVYFEQAGAWPQYAPWWVQKHGPALLPVRSGTEGNGSAVSEAEAARIQEEAAAAALTGVVAMAAGEKCAYFLDEEGDVWYVGQPAALTQANYATLEPLWASRAPGTPKAIAICGTRYRYTLLLADGTVRDIGVPMKNVEEGKSTAVRALENPGLSGVTAIAQGEYSKIALKSNGSAFVWGSNVQGGLGRGRPHNEPAWAPIELLFNKLLIAVAGNGVKEGNGANNGDAFAVIAADKTLYTWGNNYSVGSGAGTKYLPWGVLGDFTSENRSAPVKVAISGVTYVCVNSTHMVALQEGAEPAAPSITTTVNGDGSVTVSWVPVAGTPGTLPVWRAPEGWSVKLVGPSATYRSPALAPGTTSWTSPPALAAGEYQVRVVETATTETPAVTGTVTLVENAATINWAAPAKPEPAFVLEIRRPTDTNSKEQADWVRVAEAPGTARSAAVVAPPPKHRAQEHEEVVEARVTGLFEGSYKTRIALLTL